MPRLPFVPSVLFRRPSRREPCPVREDWAKGHPMGPRPRTWFGPEDDDGVTDPTQAAQERWIEQHLWDLMYQTLSRRQRWACAWRGQLTEPIGHHGQPGPRYPVQRVRG